MNRIYLSIYLSIYMTFSNVHCISVLKQYTRLYSTVKSKDIAIEPLNWLNQWKTIEQMRSIDNNFKLSAPVDTMGAEALVSHSSYPSTDKERRFRSLIGTMLSPQTKDKQTSMAYYAIEKLLLPDPFLPSSLCKIPIDKLEEAIKPVLYHKTKAKNILIASNKCLNDFGDDIPSDLNDLLAFPGIGPKIAYLTFTIAWNKTLGICVDTHVHRISNRLGWTNTWHIKSNGPEKSRIQLQQWLPYEYWENVNYLLVGFGQTICDAKIPKCNLCKLTDTCKYYNDKTHMR